MGCKQYKRIQHFERKKSFFQVGEPCIDRQRFNISRRTSMTSQGITGHHTSSPTQEDLFQRASFYTTYLQQCPRSPTRRHTNIPNHQQQQASVTWVARQSSELEPEPLQPPQNSNTLSPRPQGGSQKQRINRRRRQKPGNTSISSLIIGAYYILYLSILIL